MEQGNKRMDHIPGNDFGGMKLTFHELEAIANSIPGGVAQFAHDEGLTLLYANDGFYQICGYSREDLAGKTGNDILCMLFPDENRNVIAQSGLEQLQPGGKVELECRLIKKNGGPAWVRLNAACSTNSSGVSVICCIFADITGENLLNQKLRHEQERYRMITEQLNDVFFEYNFENDTIYVSSKWEELFGYRFPNENVLAFLSTGEAVYDDDKKALSQIPSNASQGILSSELEIRFRKAGGGYIWTSVSATVICDDEGNPVKAIGKVADIDQRIREREKLISSAQRDPLTKLYNKVAVESYIRTCIRASDGDIRHALLIIDIDNFKGVNDNLGHLFGDAVLSEISAKLRTLFRSTDIIGRFGGDEFVVFLKNVGENDKIAQKAQAICDIFRETYTGQNRDYKISGSIGIAMYPNDGQNFYELFKKADSALYEAKNRGKDGFVIFGENEKTDTQQEIVLSGDHPDRRSAQQIIKNSFTMDIYEMLSETRDGRGAIQFILRMIGLEFRADRVLIYENDGGVFLSTYEWYAESTKIQKERKKPYGDFSNAYFHFITHGFYYCSDIEAAEKNEKAYRYLKSREIKSFLQCPVFDGDVLKGVVSFDFKSSLTEDEQKILIEISKIIGSFLLRYRSKQELKKERDLLRKMADSVNLWSYVIHPDTYRLLYMNPPVKRAAPGAQIGDYCYRALKMRDDRCENCPVEKLGNTEASAFADIYDAERDLWFNATASPVNWNGDKAALLCQTDITRYVNGGKKPMHRVEYELTISE